MDTITTRTGGAGVGVGTAGEVGSDAAPQAIANNPERESAIRNGARIIRPLLVVVCLAMAAKLLFDPSNPVWVYFR